ncbi:DUF3887 domain-containing protein [Cyanobacterium aponinum AL20118]|uniref:DUF3887 domain-containing protein n=3 Tax=Cyanobacterium TaxID=102234 RepID=A0A844GT48_9CHRO|nr:DUF3887 domain-containing protein [Cyanobacterium aponinum]MBD2393301.1 DUF3887 domain-containing protein [Cyanobacterium aponinum FACHB-4101]MTF39180.1 DUF3887 domain-containing protein [Cyanobacterium aponinum 0216]WPF89888.1 DUF3887 domain-containing protein [Cyanobacterium aponinum AL20115]
MKISRFIAVSTLSALLAGFSYQTSGYAQKLHLPSLTAQSNNQDTSAILKEKAETIIELFFAQDFEKITPYATPELRNDLSQERMERLWNRVNTNNGEFKGRKQTQVIETPGSDLVFVTLEFENVTEDWIVIFNDSQEVVGVDFPNIENIETIAQQFVEDIAEGNYSEARGFLHPFLKESIFSTQIETEWNQIIAQNGDFKGIKDMRVRLGSSIDSTDIVVMDLQFNRADEQIVIIFDSSRSIIGLDFVEQ